MKRRPESQTQGYCVFSQHSFGSENKNTMLSQGYDGMEEFPRAYADTGTDILTGSQGSSCGNQ